MAIQHIEIFLKIASYSPKFTIHNSVNVTAKTDHCQSDGIAGFEGCQNIPFTNHLVLIRCVSNSAQNHRNT